MLSGGQKDGAFEDTGNKMFGAKMTLEFMIVWF
jgi:hypothetical protein